MLRYLLYLFINSLCLGCLLVVYGCDKLASNSVEEKEEVWYKRGVQYKREGEPQKAMAAYLRVIEKRRDAPESHLDVGWLYLEHFKDPISAIYHFRKFLEARPNVAESPMVRQMIDTAKKEFVKTLPGVRYEEEMERVDLMHVIKELKEENNKLKKILAQKHAIKDASLERKEEITKKSLSFIPELPKMNAMIKGERFYTVEVGDTLSRVSSKVYGSSAYWEEIYMFNKDQLKSPHDLRVGLVLKIPAIKESS